MKQIIIESNKTLTLCIEPVFENISNTSVITVFLICKSFNSCMTCDSSELFKNKQRRQVIENENFSSANSGDDNLDLPSGYFEKLEKRHAGDGSYNETTTSKVFTEMYKTTNAGLINTSSLNMKVELDENYKIFIVDGRMSSTPNITSHLHCNLTYARLEIKEKPALTYNYNSGEASEFPVHMSWVIAISTLIFSFVVLIGVKKVIYFVYIN